MNELNISQVDALFSNGSYPIEVLFYYREGFNTKEIRSALRKLSSVFWPMFGEYKDGLIFFDKYSEEDFYDEEVVNQEFYIPESRKNEFEVYSRFCQPDLKKLFFLKAIQIKNGLILIPKMSHLVGDAYSYIYFLSLLSTLSQPALAPLKSSMILSLLKPHHRRTTLKDFSFKGVELKPVLQNGKFSVESHEILRKEVQSIIKEAASSHNLQISANDVLSAIAVKNLAGIQTENLGDIVDLTIPIDIRRQVKKYGQKFFGNGIMLHTVKLKREFIENSPPTELAVTIRKSMPSVSKETYINYLTELEEIISKGKMDEFKVYDPRYGCLVTNLTRLPPDKLNFGTGAPELFYPLTIEKNSTAILAKKEDFVLRLAY